MVRRELTFALCLVCAPAAYVSGAEAALSEMERDEIREDAHRDILREPAAIDVEPDVAAVKALFARPAAKSRIKVEPLPSLQLMLQPEGVSAAQALGLVAATAGYRIENPDGLALTETVQMTTKPRALSRILATIEAQARVAATIFPEQKLIVVRRPRHAAR